MLDDIKVIKFFIRINNVPCHSFDDLQKNFYVQDVISLHRQGVLSRWLSVVGHKDKADALPVATETGDDIALGQKLVEVLCPSFDKNNLRAALDALGFEALAAERAALAAQGQKNWSAFTTAYHTTFEELLRCAALRRSDFEFLCQVAICLVDNYWHLVEENVDKFIQRLFKSAPCLFFPLFALGKFRTEEYKDCVRVLLSGHINIAVLKHEDQSSVWYDMLCGINEEDKDNTVDLNDESQQLCKYNKLSFDNLIETLKTINTIKNTNINFSNMGNNKNIYFNVVKKVIDSWDDVVQDSSKKVMIIFADKSAHLRPVRSRHDYMCSEINESFPIFDGLEYKTTSSLPLIAYIELPKCISSRIVDSAIRESDSNSAI